VADRRGGRSAIDEPAAGQGQEMRWLSVGISRSIQESEQALVCYAGLRHARKDCALCRTPSGKKASLTRQRAPAAHTRLMLARQARIGSMLVSIVTASMALTRQSGGPNASLISDSLTRRGPTVPGCRSLKHSR
jgi:hypothetical protein